MSHTKRETQPRQSPNGGRSADLERRCSELLDSCRARGIRITPQRLAVYRELARDNGHPTAEALYARLRPGMASLSLATVYRILEFLERERLVRRVSTTDAAGRFDANLERHHHLVCRTCGKMTDFEEHFLLSQALPRALPGSFRAEELDVRILGTCYTCRRAYPGRGRNRTNKHKTRGKQSPKGGQQDG